MANQKDKQKKLFKVYARNLSFHERDYKDVFICPLCFRGYSANAIEDDLLSIEHIVPSSMGGTLETLTCKACNNETGSSLDAHLKRRIASEDTLRGLSGEVFRATVQIEDGKFTADVKLSQERVEIVGLA